MRSIEIMGKTLSIKHECERPEGWTPNLARRAAENAFSFPGGYEIVSIMDDGGVLCNRCVRENYESIYKETRTPMRCGWSIAGLGLVEELTDYGHESMHCDHCGRDFCDIQE